MKKTILVCVVAIVLLSMMVNATDYYINSSMPDDTGDGLSAENASKYFFNINNTLSDDDNVYLACGSVFREVLDLYNADGSSGHPVTFDRYGNCDGTNNPEFRGSDREWDNPAYWSSCGTNLYCTPVDSANLTTYVLWHNTNTEPTFSICSTSCSTNPSTNWGCCYNSTGDYTKVFHSTGSPDTQANGIEIPNIDVAFGATIFSRQNDYVNWNNLDFAYTGANGDKAALYIWLGDHNILTNLSFRYTWSESLRLDAVDNVEVYTSDFYRTGLRGRNTGAGEAILITNGHDITIDGVNITYNDGNHIDCVNAYNVYVYNSSVQHSDSTYPDVGVYFDACNNSIARGNYVENVTIGYQVNAETSGRLAVDNVFEYNIGYNNQINFLLNNNNGDDNNQGVNVTQNTFIRERTTGSGFYSYDIYLDDFTDLIFRDNIISDMNDTFDDTMVYIYDKTEIIDIDYNLYYQSGNRYYYYVAPTTYSSFSGYVTGIGDEANSEATNPFINLSTFKPSSNSIACNMSTTGGYVGALPCSPPPTNPSITVAPTASRSNNSINWTFTASTLVNVTGTYGSASSYTNIGTFTNTSYLLSQTIYISGLNASTTYNFNITSFCSSDGTCNTTGYPFSFATLSNPTPSPSPDTLSGLTQQERTMFILFMVIIAFGAVSLFMTAPNPATFLIAAFAISITFAILRAVLS